MLDHNRSHELYVEARAAIVAKDLPRAIKLLEASVAASPHFKTLELLGEAYLRTDQPAKAVVPLAAASTLNAQLRAPSLLAQAFLALGDTADARKFAKRVLAADPGNKRARHVLDSIATA